MPKYKIICFSEDLVDVGKLKITALKPTLEKEVTLSTAIKFDENEDELYNKLKEHVYGIECQKLLVTSLSSTKSEPKEVLVNLARKFNDYVLYPKISKVLELSILERQNIEDIEENVIVAKMLREERIPIQSQFFIQEGQIEISASGSSNSIVGIKLVTDQGERILLLKEKANKLPEAKEKKKARKRARRRKKKKEKKEVKKAKKAKASRKRKKRKRRRRVKTASR
ncbi:MAG: hypothetical protein J7L12_03230 [Desulfurococcales archaeon]|nr:hypothetical protein [Desulfurococcales archaeon]